MKVILDLANNHQGDVEHGKRILREHWEAIKGSNKEKIIKFQFRDLDTFIHPNADQAECSYIERFKSTRLKNTDFELLASYAKSLGFKTACTPFDEASVDLISEIGFDYIKIASCSANDWPLLEKVVEADLPLIVSTGGLRISEIDNIVSFLSHKATSFSLMHCVSLYPTEASDCNLETITELRARYPQISIGWSTHENPDNTHLVAIAAGLGAELFERHIGVETDKYKLNGYSSNPNQTAKWLQTLEESESAIKHSQHDSLLERQKQSLLSLSRGTYAARLIEKGEVIGDEDIYFAFPVINNACSSGQWKKGAIAKTKIDTNEGLSTDNCVFPTLSDSHIIKSSIHDIKALLAISGIYLNSEFEVEYSHHYGMKEFKKVGCAIINCINRSYCKKLLVLLPGQRHPLHHHTLKEETFQLLYGDLRLSLDGQERNLHPGGTCLVLPGVWHEFSTKNGAVIEEVSSTHYDNDSIYKDIKIKKLKRSERKTTVDHWGRYQLN